jgi:putative flavoprotein involved in K+ transport
MERFDTIIIGGGQAGLAAGQFLGRESRSFVILDAHEHVGDSWRTRWDSLRVFTPAKYDGLPGMRFPAPALSFPTKNEVADYLAAYAKRFALPIRNGIRVDRLERAGDGFRVTSNAGTYEAANVIVATGAHRTPKVPPFASLLGKGITQMHSDAYRNPSQLRDGAALVVGLGNSGAEISYDIRRGRDVYVSGTPFAELPVPHGAGTAAFVLPLVKLMGTYLLTVDTPIGRKVLPNMKTAPLIRLKVADLVAAGIRRVPRVTGVSDGLPMLEDGRRLDVANVIWCTGYSNDLGWIAIPDVVAVDGHLDQHRGVANHVPGLYFVGMLHQYSAVSDVLPGVGRDARYVARQIALRRVDSKDRVLRRDAAELGVR